MSDRYLAHDWFPRPLPANVQIGKDPWLYSTFAFLHYQSRKSCGLHVGNDTGIYNGTFFDLGKNAEVTIGDFCTIVGAILCTDGQISIGDYCFISHEVVIASHDFVTPGLFEKTRNRDQPASTGHFVNIEKNVWIGAQAIIIGDVRIGEGSIVGAATMVRQDVPPYCVYAGNPGRVVGRIPKPNKEQ
jgi:acetyltransferase-like isoleucine patch superfamily enzyme